MPLPTFIIIGVQKAGTTSLYNYLTQHPQVYMSPVKEPHFLERDWDKYYAETGKSRNPKQIHTWAQYQALFDGVTDEIAIGEASVNCLFHYDWSIPQIQKYTPDVQLIALLRHPAERAHSDYLMHLRDCINPADQRSLGDHIAAAQNPDQSTSFLIRKGFYAAGIEAFQTAFGRDRVHVFLQDDLRRSATELMRSLYQTLGVDPDFQTDTTRQAQTAAVPKNQTVNALLRQQNPVRSAVAKGLKLVLPPERRQALRQRLLQLNSADKSAAPLTTGDRAALIELYRADILQLQTLIQRDLSAWLS